MLETDTERGVRRTETQTLKSEPKKIFSKNSEKTLDKLLTLWYNISTVRDRPTE